MLLRFRAAFAAVLFAGAIVAMTAAAYPLFISSGSSEALTTQLAGPGAWGAGLQVTSRASFVNPRAELATVARSDRALRTAAQDLPALAGGLTSRFGSDVKLYTSPSTKRSTASLPLARTDVLNHVRVLEKAPGKGVWLTRAAAASVGARPGDNVYVRLKEAPLRAPPVKVRVAGVYQGLAKARGNEDYWTSLRFLYAGNAINLEPPQRSLPVVGSVIGHPNTQPPKEFMLASPGLLARIEHSLGDKTRLQWNFPVDVEHLTEQDATTLARRIQGLDATIGDSRSRLGALFDNPHVQTVIDNALSDLRGPVGQARQPAALISVTGFAVALLICAAVGVFGVQRRRTETISLLTRGVAPLQIAIKTAIEAALPALLGCAAGWGLCIELTKRFGPGGTIESRALVQSLRSVTGGYILALAVIGVSAALSARRHLEVEGATASLRSRLARQPWELGLILIAGAAFYELSLRGATPIVTSAGALRLDGLTLLFPLLAVAAGAGFAGRGVGRILALLTRFPMRVNGPLYLAARRLGGAPRSGLFLVTAATLSAGVLVYAGTLSSSTAASERAKAELFVGSDVSAGIPYTPKAPVSSASFPYPVTFVTQMDNLQIAPTGALANVTAIDPRTFAATAYWDDSFASLPLENLINRLRRDTGNRLPVVAVGIQQPQSRGALELGAEQIPIEVVASARLWPGMPRGQPLLVTTRGALDRAFRAAHVSLYFPRSILLMKGPSGGVIRALRGAGVSAATVTSADQATRQPPFRILGWSLGFLNALGILIGSVSLIAALLFAQARQKRRELSYVLALRMGLTRRQHRVAIALEFAGLLTPALLAASFLGLLAARLVYRAFDPMPSLPPPALFRIPWGVMQGAGAGLVVAALVAAVVLQLLADRADVGQLMRAEE